MQHRPNRRVNESTIPLLYEGKNVNANVEALRLYREAIKIALTRDPELELDFMTTTMQLGKLRPRLAQELLEQFYGPARIDRETALFHAASAVRIARLGNPGLDREMVAAVVNFTIASQSIALSQRLMRVCDRIVSDRIN
jgi:hypothetical protein